MPKHSLPRVKRSSKPDHRIIIADRLTRGVTAREKRKSKVKDKIRNIDFLPKERWAVNPIHSR
jgi:hypothetical protein